jgi:hypothetical protein
MINNNTQRDREKALLLMERSLLFPGSARVSRAGYGASPKQSLHKVRDDDTSSPTRETRALPERCSDACRREFVLGKLPSTAG